VFPGDEEAGARYVGRKGKRLTGHPGLPLEQTPNLAAAD